MRTYPVKLGASDGMPTSLFDPRWRDPAVAARVAFTLYCRHDFAGADAPLAPVPAPQKAELTDARTFPLVHVHDAGHDGAATRFKGGSYGELHRHYALGGSTAGGALNFHAQAVCFGADDAGRFFLHATVGRFDGPWGNDALLTVTFHAGADRVGAIVWHAALDPVGDKRVRVVGVDPKLAQAFARLDRAEVAFTARHGKDAAPPAEDARAPRLSRARRAVVAKELARALALADAQAKGAAVKKLVDGLHDDDLRAIAKDAGASADAVRALAR